MGKSNNCSICLNKIEKQLHIFPSFNFILLDLDQWQKFISLILIYFRFHNLIKSSENFELDPMLIISNAKKRLVEKIINIKLGHFVFALQINYFKELLMILNTFSP